MNIEDAFNLAVEQQRAGRLAEAVAGYQRCLAIDPLSHEACYNLGNALRDLGHWTEAVAAYRRGLSLRPDDAAALTNLGRVLRSQGHVNEAIALYRRAIGHDAGLFEAHFNLAHALLGERAVDQSVDAARAALRIKPEQAQAECALGLALQARGELDAAMACFDRSLTLAPDSAGVASSRIFALQFHPDSTPQTMRRELDRWDKQYAQPLRRSPPLAHVDRSPDRRLRIGYISADFCQHVVGWNMHPLLAHHDHQRFEIFCYANVQNPDAMTARLRGFADGWRNIWGVADEQAAELIREDRIDILVDLSLHSAGNRLLVMAQKPAAVQATFAGYPGSTGLSAVDWRLTDPRLDPPGESDACYVERSCRLPDSFWCYDPTVDFFPEITPLPALGNGYVTVGSLNTFCKINDLFLEQCGRVMQAIPRSRLVLLAPAGQARQRVLERLARQDIQGARVEFVPYQSRQAYLAEFNRIDFCLDTLPYNGHTTSLDSLWMGVPFVACPGRTVVGRAGVSHLYNLSLMDLVAADPAHGVKIAAELAADLPRLAELRRTLRDRMSASPLTQGKQFAASVESALARMWQQAMAGT